MFSCILYLSKNNINYYKCTYLVPTAGLEPATQEFSILCSTIGAMSACLVDDSGVEPLTSFLSRKYSTAEIIILVLLDGFEPSTSPYQRDILPLQTMGAYKSGSLAILLLINLTRLSRIGKFIHPSIIL